jgi:hypothetical protein
MREVVAVQIPDRRLAEDIVAHHHTEAKQPEKATPLWQKPGNLAIRVRSCGASWNDTGVFPPADLVWASSNGER